MVDWYVWAEGGDLVGPVSDELLSRGILAGKVPVTAKISQVGTSNW